MLGSIFFGANILAGISALSAARASPARFGLVNTMVFTHLPSNVLLMLVPLMPTLPLAVPVLLARFSISQMDVPTRQSYTMAVVKPDERAAASAWPISPAPSACPRPSSSPRRSSPSGACRSSSRAGSSFFVYDFALYRRFAALPAAEEQARPRQRR